MIIQLTPLEMCAVGGFVKRQSHRAYDHVTTMLRPSCDLNMLESWANSRLIARLVAEVLGDRG